MVGAPLPPVDEAFNYFEVLIKLDFCIFNITLPLGAALTLFDVVNYCLEFYGALTFILFTYLFPCAGWYITLPLGALFPF